MSTSYSPIDEPSFTDTAFDAEEMLNGHRSDRHDSTPQPDDAPAASPYDESPYAGNNRQTASATPSRQTTYAPQGNQPGYGSTTGTTVVPEQTACN